MHSIHAAGHLEPAMLRPHQTSVAPRTAVRVLCGFLKCSGVVVASWQGRAPLSANTIVGISPPTYFESAGELGVDLWPHAGGP